MNQYHNTLYWCLLCWDLKKFKGQSIKISVTQQYKAGRQALRSLYSSINVTKDLLLLQPQSKLQLLGKTPDAEGAQEAAGSTHASLWTTAWTLQNPTGSQLPEGPAFLWTSKIRAESLLLHSSHCNLFPKWTANLLYTQWGGKNKEKRFIFISCISFSWALLQAVHIATRIYSLTLTPSNIFKFW